jgi:SOS regulatory protein LexA
LTSTNHRLYFTPHIHTVADALPAPDPPPVRAPRPAPQDALPHCAAAQIRLIRMHIESAGVSTRRDRPGLGFSTASSAEDHLQALAKKGAIELKPGTSRGLRLRDFPGMPVQGTLPLVGRVAAGSPILAAEHIEGRYKVDPALFSPHADFLLRVHGASMQDASISMNLLAVLRRRRRAQRSSSHGCPTGDRQAPETPRA